MVLDCEFQVKQSAAYAGFPAIQQYEISPWLIGAYGEAPAGTVMEVFYGKEAG